MTSKAKENTATYTLIQILCTIVLFMVTAYMGLLKMGEEFWLLFQWWGVIVLLGIAFYPLSAMIFRRFDDRGYLFSKAIGLVVTGWLMWLLASLRILPFTAQNCYICLSVCALCNYIGALIYWLSKRKKTTAKTRKAEKALRRAERKAEEAEAVKEQAQAVRAEAEAVKAQAEAVRAEAEAVRAQAKTAKERKKAAQAEAEATKAEAEAAKAEARAVKAEAEAVKAQAEAKTAKAEAKAAQAEAEAVKAEEEAEEIKAGEQTAETEGGKDGAEAAEAESGKIAAEAVEAVEAESGKIAARAAEAGSGKIAAKAAGAGSGEIAAKAAEAGSGKVAAKAAGAGTGRAVTKAAIAESGKTGTGTAKTEEAELEKKAAGTRSEVQADESPIQEMTGDAPYVIRDVPVKALSVRTARVKEVRFKTSTTPSRVRRGGADPAHASDSEGVRSDAVRNLSADTYSNGAGNPGAAAYSDGSGNPGAAAYSDRTADSKAGACSEAAEERPEAASVSRTESCFDAAKQQAAGTEKEDAGTQKAIRPRWERILVLELLFFILFIAYMYMKGFNPKAFGTEKMMDYGFMMSMFKTEYFPVEDFWFAGEGLNYYYFGQYLMTFLTKMSFNTVSCGYNLALGTGFAFCATLVYALVCQVMRVLIAQKKRRISGAVSHAAGALAAVAVTIAGNGHYIVFNRIVPMLWDILQIPGERPSYWFPNSTRYIGYVPDTHDKTIHEFPSYSFILGDVHAHVVNITFVLTLTAILFSFLMSRQEAMKAAIVKRRNGEKTKVSIYREAFRLPVVAVGFLIGIFMMSNYWDFPIYFVVAGAVILVSNAVICGFDRRTWILTAMHAVVVLAVAFLAALPFNWHFVAMANGILPAETHTPLYQLIILWGLQVMIVAGFVTALIFKEMQQNKKNRLESRTTAASDKSIAVSKQNRFVLFLENLNIADLFILILGLCAVGLVLTPEIIYMSDIYAGDYKRSNTMFKLVYQAYILFGISIGYILTRFVLLRETRRQLKYGIVGMVILLWTCGYFGTSVKAWFGDLRNEDNYIGMRADRYIYEEQPLDAAAIAWLNENVQGRPVILEANGESYTIENRVSVLTGLPTVLGWRVHEWLWHNSPDPVYDRAAEIQTIYTSQDKELVRALLDKYQVTYLFIGTCEYNKYAPLGMNTETLRQMGQVVYEGYPDMQGRVVTIVKVR